jgi:Copper type II ascorbate-dependent monooxygenase, C-terminal domain
VPPALWTRVALSGGLAAAALLAASCGSTETTPAGPPPDPDALSFAIAAHVDGGGEAQLCKFIAMPADRGAIAVQRMDHTLNQGSAHVLVYRTAEAALPAGAGEVVPCDQIDWLSQVRGVAYAAEGLKGEIALPDGISQRFTPGEVLLAQAHVVNLADGPLDAKINLTFHTVKPDTAPTEAGSLFYFDPIIDVPPHGTTTAQAACVLGADVHLLFVTSHMHHHGVGYHAERQGDPEGSIYTATSWTEPAPRAFAPDDAAGLLKKGSALTYTCSYKNGLDQHFIAGPSADKDEVCMFIGLYYPKQDPGTELCWNGVVNSGGQASCPDTLQCVGACAATDTPCKAKCLDAIAATAAQSMLRLTRCTGASCGAICKGPPSSQCTACVASKCSAEAAACQGPPP